MQVVRSNSVAQKRPPESNGTPAMDLEGKDIHNKQKRKRTKHTSRNTQRTHPKRDLLWWLYLTYLANLYNGSWTSSHTHAQIGKQKRIRTKHASINTRHVMNSTNLKQALILEIKIIYWAYSIIFHCIFSYICSFLFSQPWKFVFLFVFWNKTRKNVSTSCVWREVKPWMVITHRQKHKPRAPPK